MRNLLLTLRSALLLLLLAGAVPNALAFDYNQFVENGIRYETTSNNTVAVISNYESSYQGDITIPKTVSHKVYSGYEEFTLTFIVSSIQSYAFSGCTGLTSVSMPNSIKTIGYNAFYGCSALSSIEIPNGVESIGAAAFQNCTQLLSVTMPNSVRIIGDNLFYGCTRLKNVTLSSSIRELKGTFFGCTSLSSIEVPYSVTTLDCAFTGCTSLSNVILPGSLTTIGSRSFEDCSSLTGLYIPNSVTLIKEKAFNNAGLTALELPCTTTSIGLDAFINCRNLASVTSRAVNPPVMANRGCFSNDTYNQASLYVPNIVKNQYENADWWSAFVNTIGKTEYDNVYDGASNSIYYRITGDNTVSVTFKDGNYNSYSGSVTIPATVTIGGKIYQVNEIGYNAFKDCVGLTSVTIPTSVTKIASQAFYNAGLTTLNLPNGLQYIGAHAFNGCNRLTSLTIPVSVVHIGDKAFDGCNGITSLTWNAKNCHTNGGLPTANLTSVTIGSQVEALPVKFVSRSSISQITLPQSLTAIGDSAFYYCNGLTALTIPSGLTSIGTNAFGNCINLSTLHWNAIMCATNGDMYTYGITTATIGNEVEMLPSNFVSQSQITSISFPASVKQISEYAFYDCEGLTELVIPETIQSIGSYAFSECYGLNRLTWNAIDCVNLGNMSFEGISQVTIGDRVKTLPNNFCQYAQITSVQLPNSLQSIGDYAFRGCQLQSIEIPSGVQSIGEEAFLNNSFSLNSIKVQSGNPNYDSRNDCNALIETSSNTLLIGCKNTVIPNTIIRIGGAAFSGCSGLTSINIPNSVTSIGGSAFYRCSGLTSIVLPDAVTVIEYATFYGCSTLSSVEIGASMSSIGDYAFGNCNNLQSFISNSVAPPSLDYYSFYGVPNSMVVYVPDAAVESYESAYIWKNYNIQPIGVGNRALTVRFPDGTDMNAYTDMLLGIKSTDGEKSSHFTVSNKTSYTFSALDQDLTWHVALTNQYDDVFGMIEDISLQEYNTSVTLDGLLKAKNVQLIVRTADGQDVTAQCRVTWKDESGEILCQGNEIKRLPVGRKLYYQVVLPQQLATVYTLPATTAYTVKDGGNTIVCQLAAISQTQLSGRVKDATNNLPLYGAIISVTQSFGDNNSRTITTTTDNQGAYAIEAAAVPTALTVAATGYMSQTVDCDLASGSSCTVPDVALCPITGVVVNVNLTYTPAHASGEQGETQNWYSDYSNVDYEVYNTSTGQTLTGVHVQYPQIVLTEGANDGDVLEITATSRTNAFKPVKTTVTLTEQQATATFNILERGKIAAKYNRNINPSVTGTLYDSEDKMVRSDRYTGDALTIDNLDDGQYALITMGTSDFFNSIYDLEQFDAIGLQSGVDYVEKAVNVSNGIITPVTISEVPFLDETKFYYTGENTSFSVNKPNIVVGNYLTFRAQIDFKEQYANQVNDVQLIVDLPEGCPFYENSVMVGSNMGGYTIDGNRIIIPMTDYKAIVRFCAIPTVAGNLAPSAFVQFHLNGRTITQPIGNAPFTAKGLSVTVPSTVARTLIPISGTAIGACEVDIYDNDVLIGHTTSLQNDTWSTQCELYNPYNLSTHGIYAKVTTAQGLVLQTKMVDCFYDKNAIEVLSVTMNYFSHSEDQAVFDFEKGTSPDYYYYNPCYHDFTFLVNFTNNDTTIVSDVVVNVFTDHNNIHRLLAVYDENSNQWVASATFSSNDLPVNVSVDYSVNTEWIFTSTHLNDVLSEAKSEYDEYVQGRNDIDEMLANAWAAIEDAGDNTDALLAAYDSFDNVISQINAIYNLGIDLQSSSEYDYLSEEELEATEAEDITRMLTFLQELEQEIEFINKTYIYQEYSDYVDQQNGITISSTTCDGLSPAYLLVNGYEAIFTDNGDSIYVKFRSDTVSYVNFEENICQTIVLSDIGKSIMFASTVMELASSEESSELIEELKVIFNKIEEKQKQADQILAMLGRATVNSIKDDYTEMLANCNNLVGTFKELSNLVSDFVDKAKDTKLFTPLKSLQDKYNRLHNEWSLAKAHATKSKNINRHLFWKSIAARLEEQMPKSKFLMNSGKFLMRYAPVAASAFAVADGAEKIATVVGAASTIFPCENDVLNACRAMIYAIGIVRNIGNYVGANIAVDLALDGTTLATSETVLGAVGFIVLKYIASWGVDKATGWLFNSQMNTLYNKIGALKCQKELESEPSEPKTPPTTPIQDPSGFVYEGVPSNRLQGVTATCYYKETVEDMYGDLHEEVVLWDAEQYGQENPLLTDENGFYRWDVPVGMWQVKYEKEGYETTYSDWLPVPPPQLDVNIGMVQMRQPEVIKARAYPKAVEFEFDKYMLPEDLTTSNIKVIDYYGEESGTIELLNAEVDDPNAITSIRRAPGTGLTLASKVRFNSYYQFYGNQVTLKVSKRVKSYADLEMAEDYEVTLPIEYEMEQIDVDTTLTMPYGDSRQLTVTVLPVRASKGKTLIVRTMSPMILSTDAETYTLDNNGQAIITVHGDLPGAGSLLYSIEDYDLTASTLVKVMMESQMTVAAPTASIASGSTVEKGTPVYLRCATEGATIYYTLDGSCPCDNTPARKVYDGNPIIINGSTTIKAMATVPDLYDSDVATFVYRVGSGIKGDVNNDGEVNIADVNAIIGIILGIVVDDDIIYRADVNGDTEINIADVNEIIRIILGTSRALHYNVNCDDALHLNDVQLRPGEVRTLNVTLDNAERYSALQCDIVLPSGLTLVDVNCSNGRASKTGVMNDSTTRAMFYSMNRHQFTSNGSPVITLTVRADATLLSDSQITLTNSVLADNHNKAWYIADCAARVNNSSGINDLTAIADRVWVDGHTLFIETSQDGIAQLTMIDGVVRDISLKHGINQLQLERGIYIVVINGNSHKIAIK